MSGRASAKRKVRDRTEKEISRKGPDAIKKHDSPHLIAMTTIGREKVNLLSFARRRVKKVQGSSIVWSKLGG